MGKPEYFPKLDFYQLRRIAYSIEQKYPAIEKLTLYPGVPPRFDYVVIAETVRIDDPKDSAYFAYKQLMNDWGFVGLAKDDLRTIFLDAYKESSYGIEEKWLFLAICKDQSISKLSESFAGSGSAFLILDYHWDLFEKESRSVEKLSVDSPAVLDLINRAREELTFFYEPVERVRTKGQIDKGHLITDKDRNRKRQQIALDHYHKNKETFKFIKHEYVEDFNNFDFNCNFRRGTIGKILQLIVSDAGLGSFGAQNLYGIFQSTKPY